MTNANQMTVQQQSEYGAPETVLQAAQLEIPTPGEGQVLIRVRATSVNTPDWAIVSGIPRLLRLASGVFGPKRKVRGSDVAGVVEAIGPGVSGFAPGDAVYGSVWTGDAAGAPHGTFAEYTLAPATQLAPLPKGLSFEQAAGAVMSGVTALQALRDVAKVSAGQRVLINGASGGVGLFAIQIARALGATVTAVCSTRNLELVRSFGAHHVIDYTQDDFTKRPERYDVVMDNVLNHAPSVTAQVLVDGGVLLPNSIGSGDWFGAIPTMLGVALFGSKQWKATTFKPSRENLEALSTMLESGSVRVPIDSTYPLAQAGKAVAHMASHRARGKVVLSVQW
ncbi:MAG: NAD(P)-dependent alcohol dehydrogenase [Archangium sp.]